MGERIEVDHEALVVMRNGSDGYTVLVQSDEIVKGMAIQNAYICDRNELVVVLVPTKSDPDSFANQVAKEVEEYEQLALDI